MDGDNGKLVPVDDVAERIRATLDGLWNTLSEERPDLARELAATATDVNTLVLAARDMVDMLAATMATATDLREQRDALVDRLAYLEPKKKSQAIRDLAKYMSWDSDIPPQDIERVFEVLSGENDLWVSKYTKGDFFEALRNLAQEVFEESIYQSEIETEEEGE